MCGETLHVYFCSDSPLEKAHRGGSGGFPSDGVRVLSPSHLPAPSDVDSQWPPRLYKLYGNGAELEHCYQKRTHEN